MAWYTAPKPIARSGMSPDGERCTAVGLEHAIHLGECARWIGKVRHAESADHAIERLFCEGQVVYLGEVERNGRVAIARKCDLPRGEIDARCPCAECSRRSGHVACACGHIEDVRPGTDMGGAQERIDGLSRHYRQALMIVRTQVRVFPARLLEGSKGLSGCGHIFAKAWILCAARSVHDIGFALGAARPSDQAAGAVLRAGADAAATGRRCRTASRKRYIANPATRCLRVCPLTR